MQFDSRSGAGGTPRFQTPASSLVADGNWHNITVVRDYSAGITGEFRLYVDGALVHTQGLNVSNGGDWAMGVNGAMLTIGNHFNRFTEGKFDEVAIWRRILSDDEISTIAAEGVSAPASGSFVISDIDYSPGTDEVTLTWSANPNATYAVLYSTDLAIWDGDLGDSITMEVDDEVPDDGDFLTKTFDLSEFALEGETTLFFRVER